MDEQTFIDRLTESESYDTEVRHTFADTIVTDALRAAGLNRLADKFDDMRGDFWYA